MFHPKKLVAILSLSTLFLTPFAPPLPATGPDAAFAAKGGNGGGNGGGHSGGNGGGNSGSHAGGNGGGAPKGAAPSETRSGAAKATETHRASKADHKVAADSDAPSPKKAGTFASELKGLNAAHASTKAFAHANPNSRVGRIAAYMVARQAADDLAADLEDDLAAAQEELARLNGLTNDQLLAAYPVFDQAAYDAALDAADGDPATYSGLVALQDDLPALLASYPPADGYDAATGPQAYADYVAQYGTPAGYSEALAAAAPDDAELARLNALTDAEKLQEFTSTTAFDSDAWQADIAAAGLTLDELNAQLTSAEQAELAALLKASDGRPLSPEAKAYLDKLLTGRISKSDAEAVGDLLAPQG